MSQGGAEHIRGPTAVPDISCKFSVCPKMKVYISEERWDPPLVGSILCELGIVQEGIYGRAVEISKMEECWMAAGGE